VVEIQIESIDERLLDNGEAVTLALALVARAQTMGFLPESDEPRVVLDRRFLNDIARVLRLEGFASAVTGSLARATRTSARDDADLVAALRATLEAVDASPRPDAEWATARELLRDDLLARLLNISVSSLRRYAAGERQTPDETAWRLHLIARLLAALVGSYNDYGIRRWFERPRAALGGRTPAQVLERAESEEDEQVQRLLALAEELTGAASAA
jgi:hypothetical protein